MNAGNRQLPHYRCPEETKDSTSNAQAQVTQSASLAPILPNAFFSPQNPPPSQLQQAPLSYQGSPEQVAKKQQLSDIAVRTSAETKNNLPDPFGFSLGVKIGRSIGLALSSNQKKQQGRDSNVV